MEIPTSSTDDESEKVDNKRILQIMRNNTRKIEKTQCKETELEEHLSIVSNDSTIFTQDQSCKDLLLKCDFSKSSDDSFYSIDAPKSPNCKNSNQRQNNSESMQVEINAGIQVVKSLVCPTCHQPVKKVLTMEKSQQTDWFADVIQQTETQKVTRFVDKSQNTDLPQSIEHKTTYDNELHQSDVCEGNIQTEFEYLNPSEGFGSLDVLIGSNTEPIFSEDIVQFVDNQNVDQQPTSTKNKPALLTYLDIVNRSFEEREKQFLADPANVQMDLDDTHFNPLKRRKTNISKKKQIKKTSKKVVPEPENNNASQQTDNRLAQSSDKTITPTDSSKCGLKTTEHCPQTQSQNFTENDLILGAVVTSTPCSPRKPNLEVRNLSSIGEEHSSIDQPIRETFKELEDENEISNQLVGSPDNSTVKKRHKGVLRELRNNLEDPVEETIKANPVRNEDIVFIDLDLDENQATQDNVAVELDTSSIKEHTTMVTSTQCSPTKQNPENIKILDQIIHNLSPIREANATVDQLENQPTFKEPEARKRRNNLEDPVAEANPARGEDTTFFDFELLRPNDNPVNGDQQKTVAARIEPSNKSVASNLTEIKASTSNENNVVPENETRDIQGTIEDTGQQQRKTDEYECRFVKLKCFYCFKLCEHRIKKVVGRSKHLLVCSCGTKHLIRFDNLNILRSIRVHHES